MSDITSSSPSTPTTAAPSARNAPLPRLYSSVWRWHFYAGLIVLPFMVLLAVTGSLYLFKDEINTLVYGDLLRVEATGAPMLAPTQIVAKALAEHPGTLKGFRPSATPDEAAQVSIRDDDGLSDVIYVNPYDGAVLGSLWDGGAAGSPVMYVVRKLHSLDYVGWWANRIIEAVAGWAVLLVITGIYLWWPRGRKVGRFKIRSATSGRPWWRDLHAVTGIYTSVFILFFAFTGLPWSGVWGDQFYKLAYAAGLGIPDGYWDKFPVSTVPVAQALDRSPWIMEQQPMPVSKTAPGIGVKPASLDQITATVEGAGIAKGYAIAVPTSPDGVFTASVYPDDVRKERVVHLDQYSGKILFDMGLAELGALGAAAEWGVSLHMGQQFGLLNQLVLLAACIAIMTMAVSAIVIWWKRRPAGGFGAPRVPADFRVPPAVFVIAIACGIFFPLVGLSLIVVAIIELVLGVAKRVRAA
ncbi:PepSY-associated TM helix domain-containing protein [Consotaella salsifontis]|uniref:Uncharacterized iron-regulated membrane protein n=1 Tax=Consotaella salsifontis TaxID=1365950 RepID=A0A1T4S1I4_9HYPH|nr:PepSY domain-containing protein [Consotaella salsifontis]SKA22027.1 Uncharacterized iron-regulated membrane protein [Consotaella salsifontis]